MVAVEALRVGDRVTTLAGEARITWIGRRAVDCKRHARPKAVWPVRVSVGAFGAGAPARDVYLSPDHAVYADDVLVPVKHLINGSNIIQVPVAQVEYFHVELVRHDVVLAEGLPVESYLDTGDRASFGCDTDVVALHPAWGTEARDATLVMEAAGTHRCTWLGQWWMRCGRDWVMVTVRQSVPDNATAACVGAGSASSV